MLSLIPVQGKDGGGAFMSFKMHSTPSGSAAFGDKCSVAKRPQRLGKDRMGSLVVLPGLLPPAPHGNQSPNIQEENKQGRQNKRERNGKLWNEKGQ